MLIKRKDYKGYSDLYFNSGISGYEWSLWSSEGEISLEHSLKVFTEISFDIDVNDHWDYFRLDLCFIIFGFGLTVQFAVKKRVFNEEDTPPIDS